MKLKPCSTGNRLTLALVYLLLRYFCTTPVQDGSTRSHFPKDPISIWDIYDDDVTPKISISYVHIVHFIAFARPIAKNTSHIWSMLDIASRLKVTAIFLGAVAS